MKEKVTGIISLLGSLGWGLVALYDMVDNFDFDRDIGAFLLVILIVFIPCTSILLYVIWTGFGKHIEYLSEIKKIGYENRILKRQIEQKELEKKLEELSDKKIS